MLSGDTASGNGTGGGGSFHTRLASLMTVLAQSAVTEINKLYDDGMLLLRLEVCRKDSEIEALKRKLETVENELRLVKETQSCTATPRLPQAPWVHRHDLSECVHGSNQNLSGKLQPSAQICIRKENALAGQINSESSEEINLQDILPSTESQGILSTEDLKQAGFSEETRGSDLPENSEQEIVTDENDGHCVIMEDGETQPWPSVRNAVGRTENPDCSVATEPNECPLITSVWSIGSDGSRPVVDLAMTNKLNLEEVRRQRLPQQPRNEKESIEFSQQLQHMSVQSGLLLPFSSYDRVTDRNLETCTGNAVAIARLTEQHRNPVREKWFMCLFCGKSFDRISHLQMHHRIHTGEKPFRCSVCGKNFSQQSNLRTHQKTHKDLQTQTETL